MEHGTHNMEHQKRRWRPSLRSYIPYSIFHIPFLLLPLLARALDSTQLLNAISTHIINPLIFVLFAAAFAVFIWGLVQFVGNLDNEESRSQGVQHMIWGIVGMVIMVSVNGIIAIIRNTVAAIGGG